MTATSTLWMVHEHGPLEHIGPNLWRVQGTVPKSPLPRHMIIARLRDGSLWVHSAVGVDDKTRLQIEALGPIKYIVVPGHFHRLDGGAFSARYPDAQVLAPRGKRAKIEERVKVHLIYDDFAPREELRVDYVAGSGEVEGVWRFLDDDGLTLVFNDVLFNLPHQTGGKGVVLRLIGSSGGPRVTRIARLGLIKDKKAFRAQLKELADIKNLKRVIPAHIDIIDEQPGEVLRNVAASL